MPNARSSFTSDVVQRRFESPDEVRTFEKGRLEIVRLGGLTLFHIAGVPHDSWVVGEKPYVSLHFMGADHYAKAD